MSSLKIGYFTDTHLREHVPGTSKSERRQSRLMKARLEECVETFRSEKVGLIVATGDLIDDETQPDVPQDLALINEIVSSLDVPRIIIPGNHDPYPGVFYEVFDRTEFLKLMGRYQILTFPDYCRPGELASERDERLIRRMEKALSYRPEQIDLSITVQHYEIYPEDLTGYPYNYKNAARIREAMERSETPVLSISGHYHKGIGPLEHNGVTYFAGKAMCEEPFPCYVIELSGKEVRVKEFGRIS